MSIIGQGDFYMRILCWLYNEQCPQSEVFLSWDTRHFKLTAENANMPIHEG